MLRLEPGTVIGGDYRIERLLSEGGMGAVYVAEQLSTGKRRALKVMQPQLVPDPKSRAQFAEEARIGARIASEHVVEVMASGVDERTGVPWLAMELLDGEELASVVEREGALPRRVVRELFLQLGHAVAAAHARGIVHRDLKPENIFVARSFRRGAALTVKVLDFGIAKSLQKSRTAVTVTTAIGSPAFMAPEQSSPGAQIRASTDVWALGLIAFYTLTGRHFWRSLQHGGELQPLLAEVLVHPIVAPTVRARELGLTVQLPAGFDEWFARCVSRTPEHRFAEAGAAVDALDPLLAAASPPTVAGTVPLASVSSPTMLLAPEAMPSAPARRGTTVAWTAAASAVAVVVLAFVVALTTNGDDPGEASGSTTVSTSGSNSEPSSDLPRVLGSADALESAPEATGTAPAPPAAGSRPSTAVGSGTAVGIEPRGEETDVGARAGAEAPARPGSIDSDRALPETPSRSAVMHAMNSVRAPVTACGQDQHGFVPVRIVFSGDGRVISSEVSGGNFDSPTRTCIARAVRSARVAPFRAETFSVNYPFRL